MAILLHDGITAECTPREMLSRDFVPILRECNSVAAIGKPLRLGSELPSQ